MSRATMHEQVMVQVNAQVDRGIARLVLALSKFPYVQTVDSCQGSDDMDAGVTMTCETREQAIDLAFRHLAPIAEALWVPGMRLQMIGIAPDGSPNVQLALPPASISRFAEQVERAAVREFKASE